MTAGNGASNDLVQHWVTTGVPGLDEILAGGLPSSSLCLVEGPAGAGKTILASQVAFHRARLGEQILIVTLLAESHGKLLNHLSRLEFFDASLLSNKVVLLSGYGALKRNGVDGLLGFLVDVLRQYEPTLLVIDGFRPAFGAGDEAVSDFLHRLDTLVSAACCTTLLLCPISDTGPRPEHTLVDGIIEMSVARGRLRSSRLLEVRKLRGADHFGGQHVFRIAGEGIVVFPRLEACVAAQGPTPREIPGRVALGIPTLDVLMDGGVMPGSTTAILGAPGAGKTLLGLSFLREGINNGETVEYFGFYESPERLVAKAAAVGIELAEPLRSGQLALLWQPPLEHFLDELGYRLLDSVARTGASRLFVDGIDGFRDGAAFGERIPTFLTALTLRLRAAGITSVFSEELPLFSDSISPDAVRLSPTIENIVLLRYVEIRSELRRLISIMKMRENAYDATIREFTINGDGIRVGDRFRKVEQTLTGRGRVIPREKSTPDTPRTSPGT